MIATSTCPTVPERVARQAALTPDAVAVTCGDVVLSYGALEAAAENNAVALSARGIGPGDRVGVALPRSTDLVAWLLGVLKCGAAYLPLDLSYPPARLNHMLDDAGVALVLVSGDGGTSLRAGTERLAIDVASTPASVRAPRSLALAAESHDPVAYVIYTSGSTGVPKGVAIGANAMAVFAGAALNRFAFQPGERCLALTTIGFDISILELLVPLCAGASVIVARDNEARDPGRVAELMRRVSPSTVQATPSMWRAVLHHDVGSITGVRLLVGGEALPRDLAAALHQHARVVFNLYGPTEATVWASVHEIDDRDVGDEAPGTVSIGTPLTAYSMFVVDASGHPVPDGEEGELCIAGPALAVGYWGDAARTATRFTPHPCAEDGERIYRTGDIARRTRDGGFHFLGRADTQVKIRGFRIELGEIESSLRRNSAVRDAVVTVDDAKTRLIAYVVSSDAAAHDGAAACLDAWRDVWNATYREATGGELDLAGWKDSVSGEPLDEREMRAWVEQTVGRIRSLRPKRILEIGCGTGLLLTRLAPDCESYLGIDVSESVLASLREYVATRADLAAVDLHCAAAHELDAVGAASVDVVILNSVLQYFPDIDYLRRVLLGVRRVLRPGGAVFLGDVRNLRCLTNFHATVALARAEDRVSLSELRHRVVRMGRNEKELLLDPAVFETIGAELGYATAHTWVKGGTFDNELSRFRCDVVLTAGTPQSLAPPDASVAWERRGSWRDAVAELHARRPQAAIEVTGVPNPHAVHGAEIWRRLNAGADAVRIVAELRDEIGEPAAGEATSDILRLAKRLSMSWTCRRFEEDGTFAVIFNPQWRPVPASSRTTGNPDGTLANDPARGVEHAALQRRLHAELQRVLPEYMVPAAVVLVDRLPRLPNGKLDRNALPMPELAGQAAYRGPRTEDETTLCRLFAEILGVEAIGLDDNFFEHGGHSLMAARLATCVERELGVPLTMNGLFEAPTVAALSERVRADALVRGSRRCVALRADGGNPPLFCLPPIYGLGFAYAGLARELETGRPIYCLQSAGINRGDRFLATIEAAAVDYVAIIRRVRERGPYHLLGWSFGGILAHAVACQLQDEGDVVASLTIVDAYPKPSTRVRPDARPVPYLDTIREHLEDALGADRASIDRLLRLTISNALLMAECAPRTFRGDALLIAARENDEQAGEWHSHIDGRLQVHTLPCRHMDLMTLQYVGDVAALAAAHVNAADAGQAAPAASSATLTLA